MRKPKTLEAFINEYGKIKGEEKYKICISRRECRKRRTAAKTQITKPNLTTTDIEIGNAIVCLECGKIVTRLQWTHFKYSCAGAIKSISQYKEKYPSAPLVSTNLKQAAGITKKSLIILYGEEHGIEKWRIYCEKQSVTNSFEYKAKKFGMTLEDFKAYNKSRSVTLKKCIERHGEEKGLLLWNEYCHRQRYTCSIEYFIEKWGEDEGKRRFYDWQRNWACNCNISKEETSLWDELDKCVTGMCRSIKILDGCKIRFDYGSITDKKLFEYNGTYWHMDPRFFNKTDINKTMQKTAEEIWEKDRVKLQLAQEHGFSVFYIWAHDWQVNPEKTIKDCVEWLLKK